MSKSVLDLSGLWDTEFRGSSLKMVSFMSTVTTQLNVMRRASHRSVSGRGTHRTGWIVSGVFPGRRREVGVRWAACHRPLTWSPRRLPSCPCCSQRSATGCGTWCTCTRSATTSTCASCISTCWAPTWCYGTATTWPPSCDTSWPTTLMGPTSAAITFTKVSAQGPASEPGKEQAASRDRRDHFGVQALSLVSPLLCCQSPCVTWTLSSPLCLK